MTNKQKVKGRNRGNKNNNTKNSKPKKSEPSPSTSDSRRLVTPAVIHITDRMSVVNNQVADNVQDGINVVQERDNVNQIERGFSSLNVTEPPIAPIQQRQPILELNEAGRAELDRRRRAESIPYERIGGDDQNYYLDYCVGNISTQEYRAITNNRPLPEPIFEHNDVLTAHRNTNLQIETINLPTRAENGDLRIFQNNASRTSCGIGFSRASYQTALKDHDIYSSLILHFLNHYPFKRTIQDGGFYAAARVICDLRVRFDRSLEDNDCRVSYCLFMAEICNPRLANTNCLDQRNSCRTLIQIYNRFVLGMRDGGEFANRFGRATMAEVYQRLCCPPEYEFLRVFFNRPDYCNELMLPEIAISNTPINERESRCTTLAGMFFRAVGCILYPQWRILAIEAITNTVVGICKNANISDAYAERISNAIDSEQQTRPRIYVTAIKTFIEHYSDIFDSQFYTELFEIWQDWLPEKALRLRLVIQQASNSGLTTFCCIGKALKSLPNIPWYKVKRLTGSDFDNFRAAMTVINGDIYYGFRRDLGPARSINFKSLGWFAIMCLVQIEGDLSLRNYPLYKGKPRNETALMNLINEYKDAVAVIPEAIPANEVEFFTNLNNTILTEVMNPLFN